VGFAAARERESQSSPLYKPGDAALSLISWEQSKYITVFLRGKHFFHRGKKITAMGAAEKERGDLLERSPLVILPFKYGER
jgi:hypothetical protein